MKKSLYVWEQAARVVGWVEARPDGGLGMVFPVPKPASPWGGASLMTGFGTGKIVGAVPNITRNPEQKRGIMGTRPSLRNCVLCMHIFRAVMGFAVRFGPGAERTLPGFEQPARSSERGVFTITAGKTMYNIHTCKVILCISTGNKKQIVVMPGDRKIPEKSEDRT